MRHQGQAPTATPAGRERLWLGVEATRSAVGVILLDAGGRQVHGWALPPSLAGLDALRERLREHAADAVICGVGVAGADRDLAALYLGADRVVQSDGAALRAALQVTDAVGTVLILGEDQVRLLRVRDGSIADARSVYGAVGSRTDGQARAAAAGVEHADLSVDPALLSRVRDQWRRHAPGAGELVVVGPGAVDGIVEAHRRVLGRPVHVPDLPALATAHGAALLARAAGVERSSFRGVDALGLVAERELECSVCANHCRVTRYRAGESVGYVGGRCDYWDRVRQSVPQGGPFAARHRLLLEHARLDPDDAVDPDRAVGLPLPQAAGLLPLWAAVLRGVGRQPVLSRSPRAGGGAPCLPLDLAQAHVDDLRSRGVSTVLSPALPGRSCPAWRPAGVEVLPVDVRADRPLHNAVAVRDLSTLLDVEPRSLAPAVQEGQAHLGRLRRALLALGREHLTSSRPQAVVVAPPCALSAPCWSAEVAPVFEAAGVGLLPIDTFPLHWRHAPEPLPVRAARRVAEDPRLFPVFVACPGCPVPEEVWPALAGRPALVVDLADRDPAALAAFARRVADAAR